MLRQRAATNRFGRKRIAINWDAKFPAKHFQAANVIAVFVRNEHAIELFRRDAAKREPQDELARAQSAIDQKPAMIGREQGRIPRAAASEHREAEHS